MEDNILSVELLNEIITSNLFDILLDEGFSSFQNACISAALGIFFDVPLICLNGNQALLDEKINYLKCYKYYLIRMMYSEVFLASLYHNVAMDDRFRIPFLENIKTGNYLMGNEEYMVNFLQYYYMANKVNKKRPIRKKFLCRVRKIDPLYH